jgi:hypothetical protein
MRTIHPNPIALAFLASPLAIFTIYMTWLILRTVFETVLLSVVRAVTGA